MLPALLLQAALSAAAAPVPECRVGLYVLGLSEFDIGERAAEIDFYLWSTCPKALKPEDTLLSLVTAAQEQRAEAYEEVVGAARYRFERVRAKIRVPMTLRDYPFDEQRLVVEVEPASGIQTLRLVQEKDPASRKSPRCCLDEKVQLPDWEVIESRVDVEPHRYDTSFGYPGSGQEPTTYDRLTFAIRLRRLVGPYVLKVLLPLVIVLAVAYARCFWPPQELEASVTVIVTGLLSVVALHLSHSEGLPDVGYLVAGDVFFLHAYAMLLALLVTFLVEYHYSREGRYKAAAQVDFWERVLFPPLVLGGWALTVWLA